MAIRESTERRVIYFFVLIAIALPIIFKYSLPPVKMEAAQKLYDIVENLKIKPGEFAFVALDFSPDTKAENLPQATNIIEHLLRKRIPIVLFSLSPLAEGFLRNVPESIVKRLQAESNSNQTWKYGVDWINLGFRPGGSVLIQNISKAKNFANYFIKDAYGSSLTEHAFFKNSGGLESVTFLAEFTGAVGVFDNYIQFFQKRGHVPKFGHGCTSITIPEAYIYLDSGQIQGLLEGLAGAAWYSHLLDQNYRVEKQVAIQVTNTALGVAHFVIIFLVVLGNILGFFKKRKIAHG